MEIHFRDAYYILEKGGRIYRDEVTKHYDGPVTLDMGSLEPGELIAGKLTSEQVIRDIVVDFERNPKIQNEGLATETVGNVPSLVELEVNKFHSVS
jgi:hypothetical protein